MAELVSVERAWERLQTHLEWADAFWVVFVFTDDPRVAAELGRRTQEVIETAGRRFVGLRPALSEDLRPALADGERGAIAWIDLVRHDARPREPLWRSSWERTLMQLNERREWLRRGWDGGGIVFATTLDRLGETPVVAPDLWTIRALVLCVEGLAAQEDLGAFLPALHERPAIDAQLVRQTIARARANNNEWALVSGLSLLGLATDTPEGLEAAKEGIVLADKLGKATDLMHDIVILSAIYALLGAALGKHGEWELALEAHQRAADIRRRLVQDGHGGVRSELAVSLIGLGTALAKLNCHQLARETVNEAASIYRDLAHDEPQLYSRGLAGALNKLAEDAYMRGLYDEATATLEEAITVLRPLSEQAASALAMSLANLGINLRAKGQTTEAIAAAREAQHLYAELSSAQPDAFLPIHAANLARLTTWLADAGRLDEALELLDEYQQSCEALGVEPDPELLERVRRAPPSP